MDIVNYLIRQKRLDNSFLEKSGHPKDTDLLSKQMLAAHVEFAEMLNEWGGFKHWKSSHEIDPEKFFGEAADVMCFMFSIASLPIAAEEDLKQDDQQIIIQSLFDRAQNAARHQIGESDIITDTHNMNVLFAEMSMIFNPSVEMQKLDAEQQSNAIRQELFQQIFVLMAYFFQFLRHWFDATDETFQHYYDAAVAKNEGRIASNY